MASDQTPEVGLGVPAFPADLGLEVGAAVDQDNVLDANYADSDTVQDKGRGRTRDAVRDDVVGLVRQRQVQCVEAGATRIGASASIAMIQ